MTYSARIEGEYSAWLDLLPYGPEAVTDNPYWQGIAGGRLPCDGLGERLPCDIPLAMLTTVGKRSLRLHHVEIGIHL